MSEWLRKRPIGRSGWLGEGEEEEEQAEEEEGNAFSVRITVLEGGGA